MKRKQQSLERIEGESDDQYFLRILPKPPLTMSAHDDVVADWLHDVNRAGGIQAIEWTFDTGNWPLGSVARGRMLHYLGVMRQRANDDAKREAEAAAREQRARQADERQQRRRAAGWA